VDYLKIRENYRVALVRWSRAEDQLKTLLGATDAADLEMKLLDARRDRRLQEQISNFARLGIELDRASDQWDTAQMLQARKTAAATAQLDKDLRALDC
jgi:hypothetical protein